MGCCYSSHTAVDNPFTLISALRDLVVWFSVVALQPEPKFINSPETDAYPRLSPRDLDYLPEAAGLKK